MGKKITTYLILVGVLVGLGFLFISIKKDKVETPDQDLSIENFDDCVAAGFAVMESYPEQCKTDDGRLFVNNIGNELEKRELISIDFPRPNQIITSPVVVTGQARGVWFFEASFPVTLEDENGNVLVQSYAMAQDEWMTEEFVAYKSEVLIFDPGDAKAGRLILSKDNPSGLPEHDDSLIIPVKFQ